MPWFDLESVHRADAGAVLILLFMWIVWVLSKSGLSGFPLWRAWSWSADFQSPYDLDPTSGTNSICLAGPGMYNPSPVQGYKADRKSPFLGRERFCELKQEGKIIYWVLWDTAEIQHSHGQSIKTELFQSFHLSWSNRCKRSICTAWHELLSNHPKAQNAVSASIFSVLENTHTRFLLLSVIRVSLCRGQAGRLTAEAKRGPSKEPRWSAWLGLEESNRAQQWAKSLQEKFHGQSLVQLFYLNVTWWVKSETELLLSGMRSSLSSSNMNLCITMNSISDNFHVWQR